MNKNNYREMMEKLDHDIELQKLAVSVRMVNDEKLNELISSRNLLSSCRNELCLKCGKYKNEHLGACKDCRWE